MKRIILFSELTESNQQTLFSQLFPIEIKEKTLAYMPSGGLEGAQDYTEEWGNIAKKYGAKFNVINNRSRGIEERTKLLNSNILVISGGNTFDLLHHLRQSGLDLTIKQFSSKPDFVLSGFSAGALVLTPRIDICNLPGFDENLIGLQDLTGLGLVDFELFPHYDEGLRKDSLNDYRQSTNNFVREITDEDCIIVSL